MRGWVRTGVVALFILKTLWSPRGDHQHNDSSQNNQEKHNSEHREYHPNHYRSFASLSLRVRAWPGWTWSLFLLVDGAADYRPRHSTIDLDGHTLACSDSLVCAGVLGPFPNSRSCRSRAGPVFVMIFTSCQKDRFTA